jgi:hypothetical protein
MVGFVTHIPFPAPRLIVGAVAGHDIRGSPE